MKTPYKKTATFVKDLLNFRGDARLYHCQQFDENGKEVPVQIPWVVVSAIDGICDDYESKETFIFASDNEGNITDWCELPGSFKGDKDHSKALNDAGYVEG